MASGRHPTGEWAAGGVLARLARDVRGNVAAMLAMMLVPLMLFVGSAVDVSRVYTVKARLQQACDAGVLAGRRTMTGTAATLDTYAKSQANAFFNNNFHIGWMQTAATTIAGQPAGTVFVPTKTTEGQVSGLATASVPMAIMRMFGFQPVTLTVNCEARYDTSDTDIMFVLDVTGSMACQTSDGSTDCNNYAANNVVTNSDGSLSVTEKASSRIDGLRTEVLKFFDTVTKLKADGGSADPSTSFRFGFVPYSATANVGKALKDLNPAYLKTSAPYQTRSYLGDGNSGSPSSSTSSTTKANCAAGPTRDPATAGTYKTDANGNPYATSTSATWSGGTCTTSVQTLIPNYIYQQKVLDTSGYIASYGAGASVDNPASVGTQVNDWFGCVEERIDTNSNAQTSFSYTSPPKDLDPDTPPATASDGWAPWWPDVEFYRASNPTETVADNSRTIFSRLYYYNGSYYWASLAKQYNEIACPVAPAKRMKDTVLPGYSTAATKTSVRNTIQTYLSAASGFRPYGTTYHDVGMLWGLRLLSPTGMFAADTAAWPGHNPPNRFIIFLTDGDMESDPVSDGGVYSTYGMEKFDKRVGNGSTDETLDNYHNARFTALCQMAKNRNIKIFTIAYAQAKTPQLIACASPNQDYYAGDSAGLNTAFNSIAQQVAMLRVSK